MSGTKKNRETIGSEKYSPRELSQLVRRRMIQKDHGDDSKYTRKVKHKNKREAFVYDDKVVIVTKTTINRDHYDSLIEKRKQQIAVASKNN